MADEQRDRQFRPGVWIPDRWAAMYGIPAKPDPPALAELDEQAAFEAFQSVRHYGSVQDALLKLAAGGIVLAKKLGVVLLAGWLFCVAARAQEAPVVVISPADQAAVAAAWERKQAAERDWTAERERIAEAYLKHDAKVPCGYDGGLLVISDGDLNGCERTPTPSPSPGPSPTPCTVRQYRPDWDEGFRFGRDFGAVVPGTPTVRWGGSHFSGQLVQP